MREAHLRSVLDTDPGCDDRHRHHGIMRSFSAAAERLFGFAATEAIGQNVSMLMPSPYRDQHDAYLGALFCDGRESRHRHPRSFVRPMRKDGATFPMELAVGEMLRQAPFLHRLCARSDRTAADRAAAAGLQSELIHMSRFTAMGEMASTLAHELNQPLTAVASYLKAAAGCWRLEQSVQNLMLRDAIDRAADQALRAGQIIRRLRHFVARGESERHVENLTKLIEEASALALVGVREAGVRCRL